MYATVPGQIVRINIDPIKNISIGNGNTTQAILEIFKEPTSIPPGTKSAGKVRMAALPLQSHKQCGKSIHPSISELRGIHL